MPAQPSTIINGAMAVRLALCRHFICFRTVYKAAAMARPQEYARQRSELVDGFLQWLMPFWAMSAACWTAQYAMTHVERYGMTREQLGQIAINGSKNAMLNPRARAVPRLQLPLRAAALLLTKDLGKRQSATCKERQIDQPSSIQQRNRRKRRSAFNRQVP